MIQDQEILTEFIIETNENLTRLNQDLVAIESRPKDAELLASIFRTFHTIKGTTGFLGFTRLEALTHIAENILSQLRNGERDLTPELVSLILETTDVVTGQLAVIEATGQESPVSNEDLEGRLRRFADNQAEKPVVEAVVEEVETEIVLAQPVPAAEAVTPALPSGAPSAADSTIRVDVGMLDKLMNLVGELVLSRNQILQYAVRHDDAALGASSQHLNLITTELQEGVMKTRMQPIGTVWNKLPRVVRDLANATQQADQTGNGRRGHGAGSHHHRSHQGPVNASSAQLPAITASRNRRRCATSAGKPAAGQAHPCAPFTKAGTSTSKSPTTAQASILRRSRIKRVDKGLIRADQAERMDDRDAMQLIFLPGFSTAEKVTNISGRGVGMDVVKTNVERIGGAVEVASQKGTAPRSGSRFLLRWPSFRAWW